MPATPLADVRSVTSRILGHADTLRVLLGPPTGVITGFDNRPTWDNWSKR